MIKIDSARRNMAKYICTVCGSVYDEEKEGIPWGARPGTWTCPFCGIDKSAFVLMEADPAASSAPPAAPGRCPRRDRPRRIQKSRKRRRS